MISRLSKKEYYINIAKVVSQRSTCLKRKYGCVIVNNDEIIATGYNGSVRGKENCCDVGKCKRMNIPSNSGLYDECHSIHAEQNALISASRRDMIGAKLYLYGEESVEAFSFKEFVKIENPEPCPICKRMIQNSGIIEVIS